MKKTLLFLTAIFLALSVLGQNAWKYPLYVGTNGGTGGSITLNGATSGSATIRVPAVAGVGTIFQLPGNNGTNGYVLSTNGSGVTSWVSAGTGMSWPASAGIAVYAGAGSWGASITNNSTNWNTAYTDRMKWDGGSTGLVAATGRTSLGGTTVGQNIFTLTNPGAITFLRINADNSITARSSINFKTDLSLENVTNESKATMFISPVFTGTTPRLGSPVTDTLATQAYARSYGGTGTVTIGDVRDEIADSLNVMRPLYVAVADTATMLSPYALLSEIASDTTIIHNYFEARVDSIVEVLADTANLEAILLFDHDTDTLATRAYARSLTGVSIGDVRDEIADSLNVLRPLYVAVADTSSMLTNYILASEVDASYLAISDTATMLSDYLNEGDFRKLGGDTIPIFVFGLGSGQTADTASFNDNAIAGSFYNSGSDTLHITSLRGVLAEGTGTETISVQVSWHATFKSGSATNLNSSALAITSITTGDADTSFDNNDIPPGVFVWCTLSGTSPGNRPSLLILTLTGYRYNRSY